MRLLTHTADEKGSQQLVKRIKIQLKTDLLDVKRELGRAMRSVKRDSFLTVQDVWEETELGYDVELLVFSEQRAGALPEFLEQHHRKLDVIKALEFFLDIASDLRWFQSKGIEHGEVLVVGDGDDLAGCHAVLCSRATAAGMRICGSSASLERVLSLGYRQDPDARMASKAESNEVLEELLMDLLDALTDAEYAALSAMRESSEASRTSEDLVAYVSRLRDVWLLNYPLSKSAARGEARAMSSVQRRRPLLRVRASKAVDEGFLDSASQDIVDELVRRTEHGLGGRMAPVPAFDDDFLSLKAFDVVLEN